MLKTIALTAALAMAAVMAPTPGSEAHAARETYVQCVHNIDNMCLPGGPMGPILPEAGTPEYEAYQACYETQMAYCASLPDAP